MLKYLNSDAKLVLVLNVGAFVFLGEAWATYLPEFYYHCLYELYAHSAPNFLDHYMDYRWIALGETLGLAAFHSLIWIVPYRLLTVLNPIKTVPYLYVLSIGTVALLHIEKNGLGAFSGEVNLDTAMGWETIDYGLIYILPTIIFHGYFKARSKATEQA